MAYVDLQCDEKPVFEKTLFRELEHEVVSELCMYLNPSLARKDYRALAGKMRRKFLYVKNLEYKNNPTQELLSDWCTGSCSTVSDLIELLKQIDRYDAIDLLKPHEFTVVERRSRPYSIASSSSVTSTKQPCENDLSDDVSSISYMQSDDDERRNFSDPPESYRSNPSDSSTVVGTEENGYDTDEELQRKLEAMGNAPMETQDDSSIFHPHYTFRHREGSSASTSSANTSVSAKSIAVDAGSQTDDYRVKVDVHTATSRPPHGTMPSPTTGDIVPSWFPEPPPPEPPITASGKVALLIGNQFYEKFKDEEPLCFPHKDVYDFKLALEELGFTVLSLVDLTLTEMRTVMLAFCKLLAPNVFAVFYFAGHGYEENGENYLMPVDASPSRSASEFIAAQEILLELQLAKTALNLLIIDACRVNGVDTTGTKKRCSLRQIGNSNTIIAYSCQSQMPAFENRNQKNGVYMAELLMKIKEDKRIEHILMDVNRSVDRNPYVKQRPVFETDSIGDCRLTCRIDERAQASQNNDKTDRWVAATMPPDPQFFPRPEEKVEFQLKYTNCFCNVMQIDVRLKNLNKYSIFINEVELLNGEQLLTNPKKEQSIVHPGNNWTLIYSFRIKELQKIKDKLLLVLQLKGMLVDVENAREIDDYVIELKLNAGFPLIASCLNDFHDWITSDGLPGLGKNTWV